MDFLNLRDIYTKVIEFYGLKSTLDYENGPDSVALLFEPKLTLR
jgi:hypothetical protein